ncbi:E3 ubiquitin-protein ligase RBBP6 isoform X2 [Anoplophora glabripennis]|uniref:E3 ubiquitin-protein ligase RBBP6 isoform X2 n=1 Tax=Anoplophora glabripennis TaxID=217634 RepID=UPI0008742BB3|nr:E3 ubiquitin-protein ligase RBBP6 isoform X2 [Anoplophora glabripennis]
MSVHYKFKSALEYDTVTFDGLHISVKDLKNAILQQKRIGKSTDFDLQVTNAQTKEVYDDENALIPKNTSLLIARIPTIVQKTKQWEGYGGDSTPPAKVDEGGPIAKAVDLSSLDAPEDDKIKAMMSQSTQDYDPSNYMKIRGANQMGVVPPNYRCYKCHQGGHWIKDCTFGQGPDPIEIKKSTGIPRSFMVPVEGPQVQGAMMTPNGSYAVPVLDHQAYTQKSTPPAPVPEPKPEIPEDLLCNICSDLLTDAVMIPCCGNSFCDECIRSVLLESEDHECPDCHEKDISPGTLIPNRFLRKSVGTFKNTTGYVKKPVYRQKPEPKPVENTEIKNNKESTPPQEPESTEKAKSDAEEKTVISEADSTEQARNDQNIDFSKDIDINEPAKSESESIPEGPPGVSPRSSPKDQHIHRVNSSREPRESRPSRHTKHKSDSPRKNTRHRRSPNYSDSGTREDRPGTPTVDEPTGSSYNPPSNPPFNSSAAPPGTLPPMMGNMGALQGPPQTVPTTYSNQAPLAPFPPTQGPPPNFRLPPPGTVPPPYMPPGPYSVPPRALFDTSRPPLGGPPPSYQNFPPGARGHRDYGRRMRERTPPGVIDDPLAAFNKMLREKDERERRAKQRNMRRSYSRSRSRSRSFSRSPVRRRSRSPRNVRRSRSRSRSFSLSRSRSRSFSGSLRGSPYRQLSPPRRSPPPPLPPRRGPSRYRSPIRSPPRGRHQNDRHRDRDYEDDRDRDYNRDDRPFKDNRRGRESRDRRSRERDRDRYYDNYEDRRGPSRQPQWQQPTAMPPRPMQDNYYAPPDLQQGFQTNRYPQVPPRDFGPPFMNKEPPFNQPLPQTIHSIQPQRHYEDIAPPGVDDDIAPPGVEEPLFKISESKDHRNSPRNDDKGKETNDSKRSGDKKERDRSPDRKRRHEKRSRTPDKARNPSPKRKSKSKERDSPDKHRRRRRDSSDREEKDRRRDHSDDERSRKGKDKKKHKDKKESEKRKKRDKKEKHKKDNKEKKSKDEFKQVIPKNIDEDSDQDKRQQEEKKKRELEEERQLEEKRLEAIKEEEQALKEEKKRKPVEEEKEKVVVVEEKKKKPVSPEPEEQKIDLQKLDLYEDMLSEEIDTKVIENYGKIEDIFEEESKEDIIELASVEEVVEEGEIKEFEDEEKDVLELHTTDMDLKAEVDKSDILAPVPEKSKWEVEEDGQVLTSPQDSHKSDSKSDKSGKVTNEVLKRAENAIFAKAINAIRPIEIKKISTDRAKLYSGEREIEKGHNQIQITVASASVDAKKTDPPQPPVRLSVKERLGIKVEDTDKVINLARNRSRTISPFSRRGESGRNYAMGERRVEVDEFRGHRDRNRRSRSRRRENSRERFRNRNDSRHHRRHDNKRSDRRREHSSRKEERSKHDEDKKTKRKRSRSRSESEDRKDKHKKKDRKQKKEKPKKNKDEDSKESKDEKDEVKPQPNVTKRKPTIDEANFEPDYDLESHTDEEEEKEKKKEVKKHAEKEDVEKKSSSSESDSESSSEEDRKKKKHKKHKKKKKRETSSSSSSESESDSSDSERDRKKKKHKKNKKKKKKSKHK